MSAFKKPFTGYKLIHYINGEPNVISVIQEDVDIDKMLFAFECFLRGCSYVFNCYATLKLVDEKEESVRVSNR